MRMAIREMSESDIEGVARVRIQGWRYAYPGMVPREVLDGLSAARFAAGLRRALPDEPPGRVHLVADGEGVGVVGWSHFGPYRPVEELGEGKPDEGDGDGATSWGELYAIYVLPEFIGVGIGRALMRATLDGLADGGHEGARLWVLRGNAPSRRFYERAGFAHDGAENVLDMEGEPVTEVRYARWLRPPA
jgi:GNAT superfamily N-acetyltransferase